MDFDFNQGVMSYVLPQLFDKGSTTCTSGSAAIAGHPAAVTPASPPGQSDWLVIEAAPLQGQQNIETPCTSFDNCGMTGF